MVRSELNVSLSFFFCFEGVPQLSEKRVRGSGPMAAILHAVALFPPKKAPIAQNNNNEKERIKKLQVVFIGLQAAVFSVIYSFISLLFFFR